MEGTNHWHRLWISIRAARCCPSPLSPGQLARARGLEHALTEAAIWSPITATVYLVAVWYHWRKGRRCRICAIPDTPASERHRQARPRSLQ